MATKRKTKRRVVRRARQQRRALGEFTETEARAAAVQFAKETEKEAKRGNCRLAYDTLLDMQDYAGQAEALAGTERGALHSVKTAQAAFRRACIIKR